ncbi:MAG: helix-turn-helix domain-containing protein [Nitrospirae bacterium]|nr:helix-turn-helix domain-containing protein [Nitrospirota bacterium]MBI3352331.1 helix-turn-helix domain-containing protein [Nitrospirota bacterium]
MNRYQDSNYYELLEVPQDATLKQIKTAYFLAKKTFGEKNLATLSLFSEEERAAIWLKIEEAYHILSDFDRRKSYDIFLARGSDSPDPWAPVQKESELKTPISFPDSITGSFLKNLREQKGISLQNLVSHTRIGVNYLVAIEENQFKNFPAEVYLKSYLSEYAKYLNVDPKNLTRSYLRHYHSQDIKKK